MLKIKKPTCTGLILEALRASDDFMNQRMLRTATGCNADQVSAALHSLRHYQVVDVVVAPDGCGWWFACPAEDDTRLRQIDEIVAGITRSRKPKKDATHHG